MAPELVVCAIGIRLPGLATQSRASVRGYQDLRQATPGCTQFDQRDVERRCADMRRAHVTHLRVWLGPCSSASSIEVVAIPRPAEKAIAVAKNPASSRIPAAIPTTTVMATVTMSKTPGVALRRRPEPQAVDTMNEPYSAAPSIATMAKKATKIRRGAIRRRPPQSIQTPISATLESTPSARRCRSQTTVASNEPVHIPNRAINDTASPRWMSTGMATATRRPAGSGIQRIEALPSRGSVDPPVTSFSSRGSPHAVLVSRPGATSSIRNRRRHPSTRRRTMHPMD